VDRVGVGYDGRDLCPGLAGVSVIDVDRFVVRSSDREAWLEARNLGVTATMVQRAFTPAGMRDVLAELDSPRDIEPNAFMSWGNEREPFIAAFVKERHGLLANDWLIAKGGAMSPDRWMMATPDGLSLDHKVIGEYKTSGKPLDKIPAHYMRQVQWQMWVTDAESCVFAYELRIDTPGGFAPGMVETQIVERDEELIEKLIAVAEKVQQYNVFKSQEGED